MTNDIFKRNFSQNLIKTITAVVQYIIDNIINITLITIISLNIFINIKG